MILPTGHVQISSSDPAVNRTLRGRADATLPYTAHFSQNEEYFVRLPVEIEVPSYPIHHELTERSPNSQLRDTVRSVVTQLQRINPSFIGGLTHLFDPASIQRPAFFRLFRLGELTYLYLVRLDLTYRPRRARLVERTSNTRTAHYVTKDVFFEADILPLDHVETTNGKIVGMQLEQPISDTWIGETGRGYMRAGMWLDRDLTKFFSRLFVPDDRQTYPYFPFTCKYRTVAHSVIGADEETLPRFVQLLQRARTVLLPHMREIEESLRTVQEDGFTERLPAFVRLKREIGDEWRRPWERLSLRMYLNGEDEREFEVEHGLF